MLRLSLFGRFRLEDSDGCEVIVGARKAQALLAVLALTPGMQRTREQLTALLWSDRGDDQARASLRQVLSGLRKDLGDANIEALRIGDDSIGLDRSAVTVADAEDGAVLLDGMSIRDEAFEEWLRDERLRQTNPDTEPESLSRLGVARRPGLVVLPFVNMSGDTEQEYFADGLTEDLIAAMSRFRNIDVIARMSSFHYKGQTARADRIGEELGVDYLVEGSVRKSGARVRVTIQLTETRSGTQLWAERYDRELEDIFVLQDDVVASIATELGLNLTEAVATRAQSLGPESLNAYDLLLQGRYNWWRGNVNEGFRLVERAVEADPDYAAARAWLALQYAYQTYSASMNLDHDKLGPKSRALAEEALRLDDADPFVHMAASMCFGFTVGGDKARGLYHIDTAAKLNPLDSEILFLRAWHLVYFGRFEEALSLIEHVQRLNPKNGGLVSECLSDAYYFMRDYARCVDTFGGRRDIPAQCLTVHAAAYAQLGEADKVRQCLDDIAIHGPEGFDPGRFARAQISICARPEDAEHWREGFSKAGFEV